MGFDSRNAAYDLSLFQDDRYRKAKKDNIVELPKPKQKHKKSLKLFTAIVTITIVSVISLFIYGQVQISELTDQINSSNKTLEESKSIQTQLEMKNASELSLKDTESKARNTYNMDTIQPNQVEYVNVEEDNKAIVNEDKQFSLFSFLDDLFS